MKRLKNVTAKSGMESCYGFDSTEVRVIQSWGMLLDITLVELNLEISLF